MVVSGGEEEPVSLSRAAILSLSLASPPPCLPSFSLSLSPCYAPMAVVVYDWSNAKALWANAHPMTSEELITAQAEAVYAADPGVKGSMPRVWAYRCVGRGSLRQGCLASLSCWPFGLSTAFQLACSPACPTLGWAAAAAAAAALTLSPRTSLSTHLTLSLAHFTSGTQSKPSTGTGRCA